MERRRFEGLDGFNQVGVCDFVNSSGTVVAVRYQRSVGATGDGIVMTTRYQKRMDKPDIVDTSRFATDLLVGLGYAQRHETGVVMMTTKEDGYWLDYATRWAHDGSDILCVVVWEGVYYASDSK